MKYHKMKMNIVDRNDLFEKTDEARRLLRRKENESFDGFIFIYSGHGYNGGIITSDKDHVKLCDIEKEFSPKTLPNFKHCPKIFIIDACRSYCHKLPLDERLRLQNAMYGAKTEIKGTQSAWYHPLMNTIEVFGNTSGYSVSGGSDSGGSLLREISNTFEQYISNNDKLFNEKTFQGLFNPIKRKLHENQYGNQVEFQERLNGIDVYISPRKK